MDKKLGFVGAGNMASAIIGGIINSDIAKPSDIYIYDICDEKLETFREKGFNICEFSTEAVANADYIFLCVKPQNVKEALESIKPAASDKKTIVSIIAGISADYIKDVLECDIKIILVMPNTPLLLGYGASAMAKAEPTTDEDFAFVKSIFESMGIARDIPENKLNEAIAVNGSTPAFVYKFAKDIADHAAEIGFDKNIALELFAQTLIGSAKMLTDSGKNPDELITMVCSPGGTTLKGMEALENNNFTKAIVEAMDACVKRAYELSK